jgi:PIN domain nuclease of toxin-antitoxin system
VILLDTSAVLFLTTAHRRARALHDHHGRLYFSPFVVLELAFLQEVGRGSFMTPSPMAAVKRDPRWHVDDPPVDGIVSHAVGLSWTRDPFDRLIAAHALYRGWRLATSDSTILRNLPASATLPL